MANRTVTLLASTARTATNNSDTIRNPRVSSSHDVGTTATR